MTHKKVDGLVMNTDTMEAEYVEFDVDIQHEKSEDTGRPVRVVNISHGNIQFTMQARDLNEIVRRR